MKYDLYVELGGDTQKDVDAIANGNHRGIAIPDVFERIRLLAGVAARDEGGYKGAKVKDYAVSGDRKRGSGYKSLVHAAQPENTPYARELIQPALDQLQSLHLIPAVPDLQALPPGSWFLQFTFTLAKPWISKDDDPFYVAESVNPVRKDKVFKVPIMAAASWKGLLRWTVMHTRLAQPVIASAAKQSPEDFAQERLDQTLLFGDEKGEEPGVTKDFAAYLDEVGGKEARELYVRKVRERFHLDEKAEMPHHSGRLMFYPTFFDQIDVEVINPHSRRTKAGTHPIYLECVPAGAQGTFTLLYVPFDLIGADEIRKQAFEDLKLVAEGLKEMFLTYGFSAKRSSGFGVAKENVENGFVHIRIEEMPAPPAAPPPAAEPSLPKYLQAPGKLKDEYLNPDGTFRERSEAELAKMTKAQKQEYEKAKKWWEREGKALASQPLAKAEPKPAEAPAPTWLKREFGSFAELSEIAETLLKAQGGAQ
jgi:CRISPR-associated protein Cmr2